MHEADSAGTANTVPHRRAEPVAILPDDPTTPLGQTVRDLVRARPASEAFLESIGVDYWFGWDRNLRSACDAAFVDADELAARVVEFPAVEGGGADQSSLLSLLEESTQYANAAIVPAIERTRQSLVALQAVQRKRLGSLLTRVQEGLETHRATARELSAAAQAMEQGTPGSVVDPQLVRRLRLDHLELAELAKEMGAEARYLSTLPVGRPVEAATRQLIAALHQHIKMSHNFILPRCTTAMVPHAAGFEPW